MRDENAGLPRRVKKRLKAMPLVAIPGIFLLRVRSGYRAYRKILKACPPEEGWRVWFMDYDGSGDTYLTCGYLQSKGLIGEHDAFAASGGLSRKVAELFPFGRFTKIEPHAALNVRLMERFSGRRLALLPLLYESDYLEYSGLMRKMAGWRGVDFMTMLKIGLEANCGVPFEDGPWEQPEFPYEQAEIDEIFAKNGLIPGKTALLAPYAGKNDLWGVPMSFYAELASRLTAAGYTVRTNSGDTKKEPPVPGTMPLLVPHRLMRPFCERAGLFIGLRSGLCDMVSGAEGCVKIIFYSREMKPGGDCTWLDFFSLNNMALGEESIEMYIPDREQWPDVIKIIMFHITDFNRAIGQKKGWEKHYGEERDAVMRDGS